MRRKKSLGTTKRVGPQAPLRKGHVLQDRYKLLEFLGKGSFGVIYKAKDLRLDLPVAVKLLDTAVGTSYPAWEARFSRLVAHPTIARTFDVGMEKSIPFIVMELVEGATLSEDLSANGPCSISQALLLLEQLCPALEEASNQDLLHGDLKPLNLMERSDGSLVLVDFGTTFLLGSEDLPTAGTPVYMASEVLDDGPPTVQSEIFSLGVCIYELLTGRLPHEAIDIEKLLTLRKTPPVPMVQVRHGFDKTFSDLIDSMISGDPHSRPQSFQRIYQETEKIFDSLGRKNAVSILSLLWSNQAALAVHTPERQSQSLRLLLEQGPTLVLIPPDDQPARSLVESFGYEISEEPSHARSHPGGRFAICCSSADAVSRAATEYGLYQVISLGETPWDLLATTDIAVSELLEREELGWAALRTSEPSQRRLPLCPEDIGEAISGRIALSRSAPKSSPGGGPYTTRSAKCFLTVHKPVQTLLKKVLGTSVLFLHGPKASGRTSLLLAGLAPVLREAGWEAVYVPRPIPEERIVNLIRHPISPSVSGRVILLDDHARWPLPPIWPWETGACSDLIQEMQGTVPPTKLVVVTSDAHVTSATTGLADHGLQDVGQFRVEGPSVDLMDDLLRQAGAGHVLSQRAAVELSETGWLPWELQLTLRWIEQNHGADLEAFNLKRLRHDYLNSALGKISLKQQEKVRAILSALATGQGSASLDELDLGQDFSLETQIALIRKMVALRLVRSTWVGDKPGFDIPTPEHGSAVLEILGLEYLETRALRQFLNLEMSLSKEFDTKLSGTRLSMLRPLISSGILTNEELLFLQQESEILEKEEEQAANAVSGYFSSEEEFASTLDRLQGLPADLHVPSEKCPEKTWELMRELTEKQKKRGQWWENAILACHGVLSKDPANIKIRSLLAGLHWQAMENSESSSDWISASRHREMVSLYGSQTHHDRLSRGCSLLLDSEPAATVELRHLNTGETAFIPSGPVLNEKTPLALQGLDNGPWLVTLTIPSFAPATLALNLRSDAEHRRFVTLYEQSAIGEEFVHIPSGSFHYSGDPKAPGSIFEREILVPDLFMSRLPVTFRQYCQFLDEILEETPDLDHILPTDEDDSPLVLKTTEGPHLPIPSRLRLDGSVRYRGNFEMELPVVGINWEAANLFCHWLSEKEKRPYRLPAEMEWEKAARGGQGRAFPWGDSFHPSFCRMRDSRPGPPGLEPVGVFTRDLSPYGVRDMGGGVSEWCRDLEAGLAGLRIVRGGAWISGPDQCRTAARQAQHERFHSMWLGFRICFSL